MRTTLTNEQSEGRIQETKQSKTDETPAVLSQASLSEGYIEHVNMVQKAIDEDTCAFSLQASCQTLCNT